MDVFGKLCSPAGGQIDHSDFQELFDRVVKAGFKDITLTAIGRGSSVDGPEAMLIINSATVGSGEALILSTALSELFYGVKFIIQSSGGDVLELKKEAGGAIRAVLDRQIENLASIRESEQQRVQDSLNRSSEPYVPDESWREVRDKSGMVVDYIYAD